MQDYNDNRKKDEVRWELRKNESSIGLDCAPGKEGSVIGFTTDSSMTTRLYPSEQDNRQDDYDHQFNVDFNQDLDLYTQFGYSRKKRISEKKKVRIDNKPYSPDRGHFKGYTSSNPITVKGFKFPTGATSKKKKIKTKKVKTYEELEKELKDLNKYVRNKNEFIVIDSSKYLLSGKGSANKTIFDKLGIKENDVTNPTEGDIGRVVDFIVSDETKNIYCVFITQDGKKSVINYEGLI
jgi:hypothetical protein